MTTQDPDQFSSFDSNDNEDIIPPSEREFEVNELSASDISENLHNLDNESNTGLPDQSTSHNSGVTVMVANSLDKWIQKRKVFTRTKKSRPGEKSWIWDYFKKYPLEKKILCRVKITNENGIEKTCDHNYEITTGTGNLKSHLRQIHRILPPEENNNKPTQIISNQQSLHNFLNNKTPLSFSNQNKITNRILAWIVDDLQPFYLLQINVFEI
ncbi:3375_t:CDS:1 [Dentiscutata erythropus]|uniref:3375_t:CDS:1 n=1 Tax=Dentiscutata erythropus TaxID=1348616 RepID=A0A9N9CWB0_9GLOM|nr:3375_t:CDS:1 [Dentiscutata erythropus]